MALTGNYIDLEGWMVEKLNLKGNELIIYVCIYKFSQDGLSKFTKPAQYLADWTNSTKQSVFKVLKNLTERGLIIREETTINKVIFVSYYCNPNYFPTHSIKNK